VFSPEGSDIEYEVIDAGEMVTLKSLVEEGEEYKLQGSPWSGTVISVGDENFTIKYNPNVTEVDTGYGTATIETTEDEITITHNPIIGESIPTAFGTATITVVDEENITLDMNHKLAGETLIFDIELLEIA